MEQATLQNSESPPFQPYLRSLIIRSVYIFSVPDASEATEHPDEVVLDGIVWRRTGDIVVDLNGPAFQRKTDLHHPVVERSTELDFWRMMMPEDLLQNIIEATNQQAEMRFQAIGLQAVTTVLWCNTCQDYCWGWRKAKLTENRVRRTIFCLCSWAIHVSESI